VLGIAPSFAAPVLSHEELTTVSDDHVIITWVTTNETADTGIEYGIGGLATTYTTDEGFDRKNYHYLYLTNLYPNTTYTYRIFSTNASSQTAYGTEQTFTTLNPPSGQLLFAFATISDPQVAPSTAETFGARGRPYPTSEAMLQACVDMINLASPSFTILKGDLIDHRTTDESGDATKIINQVGNLTGEKFPIPGNHEKETWATRDGGTGWYTTLLQKIFDPTTYSATGDFSNYTFDNGVTTEEDSCYNYSFDYRGYHIILLDSVTQRDGSNQCKGHVDTTWLANDLASAESRSRKSFIFMHNVITNEAVQIPDEVISEITGGSTDLDKIDLDNRSDFLNVLSSYEADIVGVFMGHIHDNSRYTLTGYNFPFVRTASLIQFPVGFNVYKVYSNGYMQNFYKVPYYTEVARNHISSEAGFSDEYWEQLSLGSNYDRNFVITYSEIAIPPVVQSSAPANGSTNVARNQPVIINFSKEMNTSDTQNATNISPSVSGLSYSWSNSDTTLTIAHSSNFAASTGYTVTVSPPGAKSSDNVPFASAESFSFTTGTVVSTAPPEAAIDPLPNDITNDPTPTFTGITTDENSTITNLEYRVYNGGWGSWKACTALDGAFDENEENFTFTVTPEITRGSNEVQVRASNAAGATTQSNFTTYSFWYVGNRPEIVLKADGTEIINGDPIKAAPSFEVTVVTDKGLTLSNLSFLVNGTATTAATSSQQNNQTLTYAYYLPTFSDGIHDVRVEAIDDQGNISTKEAVNLIVQTTGDIVVHGTPLNYPNPFDPGTESTTISYSLSRASNVSIRIFDLAGSQIAKQDYVANQSGGKAGYNEVSWDGKSTSGNYVGNGIYIYLIITDGKVAQNGKGKVTVFKR
jgi:hypothetical protein